jgi:hypothetical protein
VSQKHNESAPNLYIEFEDDDAAGVTGEADLVSDVEALGVSPRWSATLRRGPAWAWAALPARGRKAVAGAVVLIGLGAAVGDALVAQAAQRAADQAKVVVVDAAYTTTLDGTGLDLLLNVSDTGSTALTLTQAQVTGPGVHLEYAGLPLNIAKTQQLEIVLSGQYDCQQAAAATGTPTGPSTVRVVVRSVYGTVTTLNLDLPASAELPGRWRGGRAGFCGWGY